MPEYFVIQKVHRIACWDVTEGSCEVLQFLSQFSLAFLKIQET